jgi:hypothetical protein
VCSSSVRALDSCVMSNCTMTDWAIWKCRRASEKIFLLHFLRAFDVAARRKFSLWTGFVCVFRVALAYWTRETQHGRPKDFKTKRPRSPRALLIG